MSSFANLKRNKSSFDKLTKAIEATSQSAENSKDDNRLWQPDVDKSGNGMAIIRFLPAPAADGDDALPWVRVFSHGFQGPGGWLIDNCLTTLNDKCPVCEHNSVLWNSGIEANKEIVRKQKRKLNYMANILVVSDPKRPENEGKVFLFKYGSQIMEKITDAQQPEYEDDPMIDAFSFKNGANFRLKVTKKDKYDTYEKSTFAKQSVLFGGDVEKIKAVWEKQTSLAEFVKPEDIKSYNELQEAFSRVIAERPTNTAQSIEQEIEHRSLGVSDVPVSVYESSENLESFDLDDMDDMESFKSLIE
jgi:hypothetical protein